LRVREIQRIEITCSRCGYEWVPRFDRPKVCPKCKAWLDWKSVEGGEEPSPKR
jgi:predicted Zn-ribbon and HTH transcriptional regulator